MCLTACCGHVEEEVLGKGTVLNVGQNLLHRLFGVLGDDLGTGDVVAVLSGVGDGITHACKAGLIDQVNDQLHLVNALKISVSGVVACLAEGLKACLHQRANAAAQNSLLTKEVGLGLGSEGGLENACTCTADAQCISQREILRLAGRILINSYQAGNALADLILGTNGVTRSLGRDHGNVNVRRRYDLTEVDRKAVSKHQHVACLEVRLDVSLVHSCLLLVVDQNHNNIGLLGCFCGGEHLKALCLSLCPRLAALVKTDDNMTAGFLEVQRVCVTLAAVTDDSDRFALEQGQVAIALIINGCLHVFFVVFHFESSYFFESQELRVDDGELRVES